MLCGQEKKNTTNNSVAQMLFNIQEDFPEKWTSVIKGLKCSELYD